VEGKEVRRSHKKFPSSSSKGEGGPDPDGRSRGEENRKTIERWVGQERFIARTGSSVDGVRSGKDLKTDNGHLTGREQVRKTGATNPKIRKRTGRSHHPEGFITARQKLCSNG